MKKEEFFREARHDLPGPLHGLRVVELATTWAGPLCGCLLADMGADVIKVEHPRGDVARSAPPLLPDTEPALSFMQVTMNRNKRSLALDVGLGRGREVFLRLAGTADIVVENLRPGTLDRWGIGYSALRAMRQDLVMVSISGYGQYGSNAHRPGYDPIAQAESGFLSLNGSPDDGPTKAPTFIGDDMAGLHATIATLGALRHRDVTGEGQHVDVSLVDAMMFQNPFLTLGAMGAELPRLGNEFRVAAPANVFRCRDGEMMSGVLVDAHWRALAEVIGHPDLGSDPRYATNHKRLEQRDEVNRLVGEWAAQRNVEDAVGELAAAGIPAAPVNSYEAAARSNVVREREMLQEVSVEGNTVPVQGPVAKFSRTPIGVRHGAPALGAHTDELLRELGFESEELESLRAEGVTEALQP